MCVTAHVASPDLQLFQGWNQLWPRSGWTSFRQVCNLENSQGNAALALHVHFTAVPRKDWAGQCMHGTSGMPELTCSCCAWHADNRHQGIITTQACCLPCHWAAAMAVVHVLPSTVMSVKHSLKLQAHNPAHAHVLKYTDAVCKPHFCWQGDTFCHREHTVSTRCRHGVH